MSKKIKIGSDEFCIDNAVFSLIHQISKERDGLESSLIEVNKIEEECNRLLKIASSIAQRINMPSQYIEDYDNIPKRIPVRFWRSICVKITEGDDQCRLWSIEARDVYEKIRQSLSSLNEIRSKYGSIND